MTDKPLIASPSKERLQSLPVDNLNINFGNRPSNVNSNLGSSSRLPDTPKLAQGGDGPASVNVLESSL